MSRVNTAEMALASEEHMAMVCEKKPTMTRPSRPCGSSRSVSSAYASEASGFRVSTSSGATHIGKKRTAGQTNHSAADSRADRLASRALRVAMKRWAWFHMPPLYSKVLMKR